MSPDSLADAQTAVATGIEELDHLQPAARLGVEGSRRVHRPVRALKCPRSGPTSARHTRVGPDQESSGEPAGLPEDGRRRSHGDVLRSERLWRYGNQWGRVQRVSAAGLRVGEAAMDRPADGRGGRLPVAGCPCQPPVDPALAPWQNGARGHRLRIPCHRMPGIRRPASSAIRAVASLPHGGRLSRYGSQAVWIGGRGEP